MQGGKRLMNIQNKITEKENLLKQVIENIDSRNGQVNQLNNEIGQLETQGYALQGAIAVLKEVEEEMSEPAIADITSAE